MPRVKSDETITHRIEFSPVERKMLSEMHEDMKKQAVFKQIATGAQSFSFLVVPVGLGVAAYAFWRWAGLGSIIERTVDGAKELSKDIALTVTEPLMDLDLGGGSMNDRLGGLMQMLDEEEARITAICTAEVERLNVIINAETSTPQQVNQANQDKETMLARCRKGLNKVSRKRLLLLKKVQDAI